ncbi:MAG TPA: protein kinase [Kofleriaceae bacterium]|nr:protein kinase [Kofleriaceae bacterium]
MAPSEPTDAGPSRIGRYEVLSHLATGGMAQIYLARQTGLGSFERHVVLKTILRDRAADQRFVTMFLDEAKLAATLNHQNVAQVYEVDQADGAYFMAMEYVHGENTRAILETTIRRGWTIPLELAVMIINGAAAGLHHAHERRGKNGQPLNIVHRDVSPANIMVGFDGSVKVLDFGIAKAEERVTKTLGGTIKGKYGYMSPEQCKGKPIDRRSDIFALGIVLYELTTLRRAFKGNDDFETMKRIVAGDLVLPSTVVPGFPRELETIILTALAGDSGARFQTGQELIEALDAFTMRAKLTGTNTAMGRFMVQLFGTKREPWIDVAVQSSDHTLVSPGEVTPALDDYEDENDETLVLSSRRDADRIVQELNIAGVPPPAAAASPPRVSRQMATVTPPARMSRQMAAVTTPRASRQMAAVTTPPQQPRPMTDAPLPQSPSRSAETEPAGRRLPDAPEMPDVSARSSVRRSVERPSLPFSGPSSDRLPSPVLPPGFADNQPQDPALAPAPVGTGAAPPIPSPAPSGLPRLVANEDESEVGAQPLVSDPKLGWETSVRLIAPHHGSHTRLSSDSADYRIRSNTGWFLLVLVLVIGVAIGIAVFLTS